MDPAALKKLVDIGDVIERYEPLGEVRGPYRRGQNHDALIVDVEKQLYFWNGRENELGQDVFTFLMNYNGWGFQRAKEEVARLAGVDLSKEVGPISRPKQKPAVKSQFSGQRLDPPNEKWQQMARRFVGEAQAALWSEAGQKALAYLHGRCLGDETIRAAGLGYNPVSRYDKPEVWGLAPYADKDVFLARGIVLPWIAGGDVWRVAIRRPNADLKKPDDAKMCQVKGYQQGLYNADGLTPNKPAMLLEGEIDALTVLEYAGDLVTPVATGATSHARRARWRVKLSMCSVVLVAFDAEPGKGDSAAEHWLKILPNAKRWRPILKDVNEMAQKGFDIRYWVEMGIGPGVKRRPAAKKPAEFPLTIHWPPAKKPATVGGQWHRLADGTIEAVYRNSQELDLCLALMGSEGR